jgi:hypothetical protein
VVEVKDHINDVSDLISLYRAVADLTRDHCGCDPAKPYRCCEPQYCAIAADHAQKYWGVDIASTYINPDPQPAIPFLGPSGCIVPPHLRPLCSLHACCIAWAPVAEFPGDPDRTREYWRLRDIIVAKSREEGKPIRG